MAWVLQDLTLVLSKEGGVRVLRTKSPLRFQNPTLPLDIADTLSHMDSKNTGWTNGLKIHPVLLSTQILSTVQETSDPQIVGGWRGALGGCQGVFAPVLYSSLDVCCWPRSEAGYWARWAFGWSPWPFLHQVFNSGALWLECFWFLASLSCSGEERSKFCKERKQTTCQRGTRIEPFLCAFFCLQGEGAHTASSEGPCQALKLWVNRQACHSHPIRSNQILQPQFKY